MANWRTFVKVYEATGDGKPLGRNRLVDEGAMFRKAARKDGAFARVGTRLGRVGIWVEADRKDLLVLAAHNIWRLAADTGYRVDFICTNEPSSKALTYGLLGKARVARG